MADFFADPPDGMLEPAFKTVDGDHGRIEKHCHTVCREVDWLIQDRHASGSRFAGLSTFAMVETRVERGGTVNSERRYYIFSASLDVETMATAVRSHWHIENRLHWVLVVVFHDDLVRLRIGNGPANMAVIRHMAMNLICNPKDKHSLKNRRKLANLNTDYLETLIRNPETLT